MTITDPTVLSGSNPLKFDGVGGATKLNLDYTGMATINVTGASTAIYSINLFPLEITGTGSLTLTSEHMTLVAAGGLTISGSVKIDAATNSNSAAIASAGDIHITGSAQVKAVAHSDDAAGISSGMDILIDGNAKVEAAAYGDNTVGIFAAYNVLIEGSAKVEASGGGSGMKGHGISTDRNITLKGSAAVTATGTGAWYALNSNNGGNIITTGTTGKVTLVAADKDHLAFSTGTVDISNANKPVVNDPVSPSGSGSCDAGFGMAGLLALSAAGLTRKKG